ncbi:MAG TPA: hypothetical protein VGP72_24640 [Planctomycetota bacterium]|jgi:hypothetical protein
MMLLAEEETALLAIEVKIVEHQPGIVKDAQVLSAVHLSRGTTAAHNRDALIDVPDPVPVSVANCAILPNSFGFAVALRSAARTRLSKSERGTPISRSNFSALREAAWVPN